MASAVAVAAPEATLEAVEAGGEAPAAKRPRLDGAAAAEGGSGGSSGGDAQPRAADGPGGAAAGQQGEQQQEQQPHQQQHKREHGHHGHLRTHHVVDEPEEGGGGGVAANGSGSAHCESDADAAAAPAPGSSSKPKVSSDEKATKKAKLSFVDELEEAAAEEAEGGGGGGLHAVTADRFKAEKRAAKQQQGYHAFHARGGVRGSDSGSPRALAVVDDDDDDAGGAASPRARAGAAAATLGRIHFGSASARGLRPYMEDRHTVVASLQLLSNAPDGGAMAGPPLPADGVPRAYAAIFDGHNGAGVAELAAARLHVLLAANPALRMHTGEVGPPAVARAEEVAIGQALRSAFGAVDEATLAVARREGVRDGATALVVLRVGQVLYAAHVGDSRAVLCRDGSALRLTEDHKPHLPRERARIEDAGGRVDFQRCWRVVVEPRDGRPGSGLAISRALGDLDFKEPARFVECEPDVLRLPMRPLTPSGAGDAFVILGSDGLWDVLSDEDAVHHAQRTLQTFRSENGRGNGDGEAKAVAEALLEESLRRGTADNVTAVVMLFAWGSS